MRNVILKSRSLRNVVANSKYLESGETHENILLVKEEKNFSWEELSTFEHTNNERLNIAKISNSKGKTNKTIEGRELIISLPNELAKDKNKLESVVLDLKNTLIGNKGYKAAVHLEKKFKKENEKLDINDCNLHLHLMFTERDLNKAEVYSRDIWQDPNTGKMTKPGIGILVHKKGDLKENQSVLKKFTAKDKKFKSETFIHSSKKQILKVFQSHGFEDYKIIDNNSIYLKSKNFNQYSSPEYINKILLYNERIKDFNNKQEDFEKKGYSHSDLMNIKIKFSKLFNNIYYKNYKPNDNVKTYDELSKVVSIANEQYKSPNSFENKIINLSNKSIERQNDFYNFKNLSKQFFNERWSYNGKNFMRNVYFYNKNFIQNEEDRNLLLRAAVHTIIGMNEQLKPLDADEKFYQYASAKLEKSLYQMDKYNDFAIYKTTNKSINSTKATVEYSKTNFCDYKLEQIIKELLYSLSEYPNPIKVVYRSLEEQLNLDEIIDYLVENNRLEEANNIKKIKDNIME